MRKYFDQLKQSLLAFIDQRDFLMKAYACRPSEAALILKLLFDRQESSPNDLFLLFPEPFTNARDYVSEICARFAREYAAAEATDAEDFDKLPPLPAACRPNAKERPAERLKSCLQYGRSLVPQETGHRIVWCFSPEHIDDLAEYLNLWQSCLPNPEIEAWMRGSRIVVRLPIEPDAEHPFFESPRVQTERFVIPDDAAEVELREAQSNKQLPWRERMQSKLQLAFIDLAHGRLPQAKKALLSNLAYYQQQDDPGLQALSMIGLGDICRREKNLPKAKYWYECAIKPSGEGKQLMCLAMCADHLGGIAYQNEKFAEAEFYFDQLATLKRSMPDETGLVDALLWRGRAQFALRKSEAVVASCQEALLLCKTFDLPHKEKECLAELRRALSSDGEPERADKLCEEWQAVPALGES